MNPQDPIDRIKYLLGNLLVEREALAATIEKLTAENKQLREGTAKPSNGSIQRPVPDGMSAQARG